LLLHLGDFGMWVVEYLSRRRGVKSSRSRYGEREPESDTTQRKKNGHPLNRGAPRLPPILDYRKEEVNPQRRRVQPNKTEVLGTRKTLF